MCVQELYLVTSAGFLPRYLACLFAMAACGFGCYRDGECSLQMNSAYQQVTHQMMAGAHKLEWWSVIGLLSTLTKGSADPSKQKIVSLLRRWKQIDVNITEAANEAKDNVKYLFTLERFIEPLYTGTASSIIDTLSALMNSIKMIHTIARYYNTTERMTNLFSKITDQMISNCKQCIMSGKDKDSLWEKDPQELVRQLEACLKLNEAYQEQVKFTHSRTARHY